MAIQNEIPILVTNYKAGLKNEPIRNIFPNHILDFNSDSMDLTINESLFVGVFDKIPNMRKTDSNKKWFCNNIYHLR